MIIGHQKQWIFLEQSLKLGKLPNGLIFSGSEKLGKKSLAIEFSQMINCENADKPCGICRNCQSIKSNQHPGVFFIEPKEKEIQISQIRDLIWKLSMKSYSGALKVAIIDKAHSMNSESQSALLKTLEEPKGDTIIILVTEYPEMLFPTILSRCQNIRFYPVGKDDIKKFLQQQGATEERAEEIEAISLGRPGQAFEFFSDPQKILNHQKAIERLKSVSRNDLHYKFELAKEMNDDPDGVGETLAIWLTFFRDLMTSKSREIDSFSPKYTIPKIKRVLEAIQSTNNMISNTNVNQRLALEVLMMEI